MTREREHLASAPQGADDPAPIAQTARLIIRPIVPGDAEFLVRQLNEPSWLQNIGDKEVRSVADAERYVRTGPMAMRREHGFGMNLVQLRDGEPVGVCGLVKRDGLPGPDLGFALLESRWGHGYAHEAATAVVDHARRVLGCRRLLAITTPSNVRSGRLLEKLGFRHERVLTLPGKTEELRLYAVTL